FLPDSTFMQLSPPWAFSSVLVWFICPLRSKLLHIQSFWGLLSLSIWSNSLPIRFLTSTPYGTPLTPSFVRPLRPSLPTAQPPRFLGSGAGPPPFSPAEWRSLRTARKPPRAPP